MTNYPPLALPRVVVLDCPQECVGGYHEVDPSPYAAGRNSMGCLVQCDECAGHAKVTLYLATHEGELFGYTVETQLLGTFADEDDASRLQWQHCWKADPRRWRDDELLSVLGVEL